MTEPVLSVEQLRVTIGGNPVVDGVDFSIDEGEIVTIVGESGCGKSMTAFAIMGLLPRVANQSGGRVSLNGKLISDHDRGPLKSVRGNEMAMIFQEPVASLNPLMSVGRQIAESLVVHRRLGRSEAKRLTIAMLSEVGIPEPELRFSQYPFELSGGMCQRVMIAMALITRPKLLIADEPTTALDVTIQAQILELMKRLRDETNTAILLITHDMGVVADIADRVAVMYAGRIIETAAVDDIFELQAHPYTKLLLSTIPKLDGEAKTLLPTIRGTVPGIGSWPEGCRFSTRCPLADDDCRQVPPLEAAGAGRLAACWHQDRVGELA
jgi:peptide/nickel transport system ATP-binding protein